MTRQSSIYSKLVAFAVMLGLTVFTTGLPGAITQTGNYDPAYPGSNPNPWIIPADTMLKVGFTDYGQVTVTLGNQIQSGSPLAVGVWGLGDAHMGEMLIQSGGQVTAPDASIGGYPFELVSGTFDPLHISQGTGRVIVAGTGSSLTVGAEESQLPLFVGYTGQGTLSVESNGQVTADSVAIGAGPNATGHVVVDGAHLDAQYELLVGVWANGAGDDSANVMIKNGAEVTTGRLQIGGFQSTPSAESGVPQSMLNALGFSHGRGAVTVKGDSTLDVSGPAYIGYSGTAKVDVKSGATVTTYQTAVGVGPGSVGTLTVDGATVAEEGTGATYHVEQNADYETHPIDGDGPLPKSGALIVGAYGTGTATVKNGGQMTVDRAVYVGGFKAGELPFSGSIEGQTLSASPNGTGTLTIQGSTSSLTTPVLAVGATGTGYLNVYDNASLTTQQAGIGVAAGSHGTAVVSNTPGSWANSSSMFVGGYGTGSLTVQPGGHVGVGKVLYIGGYDPEDITTTELYNGDAPNGTGTVTVVGDGAAHEAAQLEAMGIGVGIKGTGTLQIQNGGRVKSQIGVVGASESGTGTVTVDGAHSGWRLSGTTPWPVGFDPLTEPMAKGAGTVTVSNGGKIEVGLDEDEGGSKAALIVADKFTVGSTGLNSTVSVANGGLVQSGELVIGGTTLAQDTTPQEYVAHAGELGTGTGTVNITGSESKWQTGEQGVFVGFSGTGTLNVTDGQVTSSGGWLGGMPNGTGTATISGATAAWTIQDTLGVGLWGTGTLNIEGGAHVSAPKVSIGGVPFDFMQVPFDPHFLADGTGTVNVTGEGSRLDVTNQDTLHVGYTGTGTLNVLNKGEVLTESVVVGGGPHAVGTVVVDGEGSQMSVAHDTIVGAWGEGHLTISNQGLVETENLYIGGFDAAGAGVAEDVRDAFGNVRGVGTVTVTGGGSTLNVGGLAPLLRGMSMPNTLYVGYSGTGTLNVLAGGAVSTELAVVGLRPGATGHVTVDGASSNLSVSDVIVVGAWGTGNVTVSGGNAFTVDSLYIGGFDPDRLSTDNEVMTGLVTELGNPTGTGHVTVTGEGSTLDVTGTNTLVVGAHAGSGTLTIAAGGEATSMDSFIGGYIRFNEDPESHITTPEFSNGGTGFAQVTGAGSHWNTNALVVGTSGSGHLDILSGGQVDTHLAAVGFSPGSSGVVTVTGTGSAWVSAPGTDPQTDAGHGELIVGGFGQLTQGEVTVASGGRVDATKVYIGGFDLAEISDPSMNWNLGDPKGTGTVTVTGTQSETASQLNVTGSGPLYVGYGGPGTLNVAAGGQVASGHGFIGYLENSTGTVNVTGTNSTWNVGGDLFVGGTSAAAGGTGSLIVSNGGLVDVTGEMTIWRTGTLGGNGTVTVAAPTTLHNYGTIAPGNSIGTLTVNGNVVFESGSTYAVKIGQTSSDKLVVNGDTTINGGTVKVSSQGTVVGAHDYEIIHAQSVTVPEGGGFVAPPDTTLLTFSVSDPSLTYDPTSVWLHLVAANFDDPTIAQTGNQQQVGGALQEIADRGGNGVTGALQGVDSAENLRHAYDQLSGQSRPPLAPLAVTGTSRFLGTVTGRVQTLQTGGMSGMSDSSLFAMSGPDSSMGSGRMCDVAIPGQSISIGNGSPMLADSPWGLWGRGYGLFGDRETKDGVPGYSYKMYGGSVGLDYQFSESFLAGVVLGMSDGQVDFANLRDNADFQAMHIGLYNSLTWGQWYLDTVATYAGLKYDTERFVDLTEERLTGDVSGYELAGYAEVGYNWRLRPNLLLQPLASLQYTYASLGSYTETGGLSALSYGDQVFESVKGSLGARLTRQLFESASGLRADGQVRGRYIHEFGDSQSTVNTSFASDPAAVFAIQDARISRDSVALGAGLSADLSKQIRMYADYDTRLNRDETVHVISAALQYRW